ncbi:chondroitinase-B domain-containing protein [Marinifilum caeruleilacunae]|uniref:Alginate lyase n=1 Tax=Marinifilum caeruleilacunae TaxID=2499076 RepID=A0ABX1WUE8_9BACT|nr:chondroitinase-B domain-containing protein [Marinifilum caeruleilacunae]NOU59724.1 alginate lyase [Marinifilum caeruleilacunae]
MKLFKPLTLLLFVGFILTSCAETSSEVKVKDMTELASAIDNAQPGDVIVMSNGVWKNAEIEFVANGLANNPIVLKAETAGEVSIEGQSYLKIAGQFLEVRDLYFKNGYTPINSVIQFKKDKKNAAYDCKVINCVIENFTQLDRTKKDHWVEFWGQRNELRSCYIAGKSNNGPTVRAELKGNQHANCYHVIADNYFGPRPRRGGPRGETMQLGDSYTSMVPSYIQVKNNLFYECNGEVEIISSKTNYNSFSNNVFYKCEGSLVLRHGNYASIDSNWFIGDDNSNNIGGIRVINTGHWITNNYFYNLKGKEFRSPLAVMNGIPKSPQNRYNQVTDVVVAHNTWMNCETPLQFSVGSNVDKIDVLPKSEIRSALPIRTTIANNIIYGSGSDVLKFHDKQGDILFQNNYVNAEVNFKGFIASEIQVENDKALVPLVGMKDKSADLFDGFNFASIKTDIFSNGRSKNQAGAICSEQFDVMQVFDFNKYGASWFSPNNKNHKANKITVKSSKELYEALANTNNGDTILLDAEVFELEKPLEIVKSVVIASPSENKSNVTFVASDIETALILGPGVDLHLKNVSLKGNKNMNCMMPDMHNMSIASNVFVENCEIQDFKSIYKSIKGSFADKIQVLNSSMSNLSSGFIVNSEVDAKGDYNVEFLILKNNQIDNIKNEFVDFYRGGYDESTIGGNFVFENNKVKNAGKTGSKEILLQTHGIINVHILDNNFSSIKSGMVAKLWGEKNNLESGNVIQGNSKIVTEEFLTQKLMY